MGIESETVVVGVVVLCMVAVGVSAGFGLAGSDMTGGWMSGEAVATTARPTSPAGAGPTTVAIDAASGPTEPGGNPAAVPRVSEMKLSNAIRTSPMAVPVTRPNVNVTSFAP